MGQQRMPAFHFQLSRGSLRLWGVSFHQFLILIAIQKAVQSLETSDESLTNIALDVGFENLITMEYNFKNHIGCTPSKYRAAFLATL